MQNSSKISIAQRFDGYQPSKTVLVWACFITVIATIVVGFNWGGWVTGGSSRASAVTAGDMARGELASAICVQRFNAAPDAAAKRAELKAIPDSYRKRQFVEAGGWAAMPGQISADSRVAESCSTALSV
ncbi:hypothetical protein [Neorhizobium galegae]|jgi:hypothetical protein|uniref:Uncharacterized protein n=2 Tax=Neorhizobium galegae TaxID=399 RepID=A0A068STC4_NEOGA|nr:hypothetical protein [Neorhizobium galegae]CDN49124.1 Hypothetical protein RG540_CH29580 [Neorhizobium galegae bv. orientalis str. HAMBI 540]CDZ50453.1 Hypothetical protein NGAL_HAMBI2427_36630 [Neorhizobium galegae bv. orientalis]